MPRKPEPPAGKQVNVEEGFPHPTDIDPRYRWIVRCRRPATCRWISRSASISGGCTPIGSARAPRAGAVGLGAVLVFDQYNIRYLSGTVIGEWARDKLTRWCLLTGTGEPWVWDFGSAARHHRPLRAVDPEKHRCAAWSACAAPCRRRRPVQAGAQEISDILKAEGVAACRSASTSSSRRSCSRCKSWARGARRPAGDAGGAR
jgi:hypothetical protein